jgi:cysteine desulfurase
VGKIPLNVHSLGIDTLSLSGHKLHGPKGVGCLYVRRGLLPAPLFHGGHQERDLRSGTENIPAIVGLAEAITLAIAEMNEVNQHIRSLSQQLQEGIVHSIADVQIHGHPTKKIPHIVNVGFASVGAEALAINLDLSGIAISIGSACASGAVEPSHVMKAMGVPDSLARGSVRFSLGRGNQTQQIEYLLQVLPPIVEQLRRIAPMGRI